MFVCIAAVEKDLLKKKKKEEAAQEDSILTEEMRVLLSNEDKAILFDPEPGERNIECILNNLSSD